MDARTPLSGRDVQGRTIFRTLNGAAFVVQRVFGLGLVLRLASGLLDC